jgi:diacylglycerol kinase family enzyme
MLPSLSTTLTLEPLGVRTGGEGETGGAYHPLNVLMRLGKYGINVGTSLLSVTRDGGKLHLFFMVRTGSAATSDPLGFDCVAQHKGVSLVRTSVTVEADDAVGAASTVLRVLRAAATGVALPGSQAPRMVIVNPFGGRKLGLTMLRNKVAPILSGLGIPFTTVVSQHAGHVVELTSSLDITAYSGIIVVGGDGTLQEVVTGLSRRPDWKEALHIPVAIVPGGSGNGLAHTLGLGDPSIAAAAAARSFAIQRLDAFVARQPGEIPHIGFLITFWGILADIDIGSERLRWMGEARFTVEAVSRIAASRRYSARLAYLLADQAEDEMPAYPDVDVCRQSSDCLRCSGADESLHELLSSSQEAPRAADGLPSVFPADLSDATFDSLGPDWTVDDKFRPYLMVSAVNTPYVDSALRIAPGAHLADGTMHVFSIVDDGFTKADMTRVLLDQSSGKAFMTNEFVRRTRVRAFALLPEHQDKGPEHGSYIDVDGEVFPLKPTFVEVVRGLISVHTLPYMD